MFRRCVPKSAVRRVLSTASASVMASSYRPSTVNTMHRFCSTTTERPSAVNVEEWTLNEEIVKKDQEANRRWQELGEKMEESRSTKNYEELIKDCDAGFELLAELGAEDSPIQCEPMLHLEAAQAHFNVGNWDAAQKNVDAALEVLTNKAKDEAKIATVREFAAFTTLKRGDAESSEQQFRDLLKWIDVDAKSAAPMVSVAAQNMRRSVKMGIGMSMEARAQKLEAGSPEAKKLFGDALDTLIESLDAHIEDNDVVSVKQTLDGSLRCFVGLGDADQAIATCKKYVRWCNKHDDEEGAAHGRSEMEKLCKQFDKENPFTLADAEEAANKKGAEEAAAKKAEAEAKKE